MVLRAAVVATLAVLAGALAGCLGDDASTSSSSTTRACPAWLLGLTTTRVPSGFDSRLANNPTNDTLPMGEAPVLVDDGRELDIFYIEMNGTRMEGDRLVEQQITVTDARVHFRFFRADDHTPLLAYDMEAGKPGAANQGNFDWVFGPGTTKVTLQVRLSQPPSMPTPTPLLVEYTYDVDLDKNPQTPSHASWDYSVKYDYRRC